MVLAKVDSASFCRSMFNVVVSGLPAVGFTSNSATGFVVVEVDGVGEGLAEALPAVLAGTSCTCTPGAPRSWES